VYYLKSRRSGIKVDRIGKFKYQNAFGPKSPTEPMTLDSTFVFASCTKLMTSIAALQCVERGQIGLDDDVSSVLTELKDLKILTGFEEGSDKPILKKAENKITLRCALHL
jgi:CubicO group peptidase (beta-lactamase class C family)